MQCVVLAGGLGRRMLPDTERLPKCLLPVAGRPFVDWQMAWLAAHGVEHVIMSIGYKGDLVGRHLGNGRQFGLEVSYVDEGDARLGTGGALRLAADTGVVDSSFLVLYGDSYLATDLGEIERAYATQSAPVLMTVYCDDQGLERPNAVFDGAMVTQYQKGLEDPPATMRYVDYGISVWDRRVIESMVPSGTVADLADLLQALSESGQLAGMEMQERFYEIGSPRGLRELELHLLTGGVAEVPPNGAR
jgi:MurNAc alpha-1-phosphate uridylyltransferase